MGFLEKLNAGAKPQRTQAGVAAAIEFLNQARTRSGPPGVADDVAPLADQGVAIVEQRIAGAGAGEDLAAHLAARNPTALGEPVVAAPPARTGLAALFDHGHDIAAIARGANASAPVIFQRPLAQPVADQAAERYGAEALEKLAVLARRAPRV